MEYIKRTFRRSLGEIADSPLLATLGWLISSRHHPLDVEHQRAAMILARVHLISLAFAILTLLWIGLEVIALDAEHWQHLALLRIATSAMLFGLAIYTQDNISIGKARIALGLMFAIPTLFYGVTMYLLNGVEIGGAGGIILIGYSILPVIIVGGLGLVPITLVEGAICAALLLASYYGIQDLVLETPDKLGLFGAIWLNAFLCATFTLSGMSQLQLIAQLTRQSSTDALTGALVRRTGQKFLESWCHLAKREDGNLTLAFADIDDFKTINDRYGHEAGDEVLRQTTERLMHQLRKSDVLVRWGGEEFLLIMPNTDMAGAQTLVNRLFEEGLGLRPDGDPLTISMGLSERKADAISRWEGLLSLADTRMYQAKAAGKNRYVRGGPA